MAMDDASAESVGLPGLALDPCKAENLARKERRQRQRGREAAAKATAEAAGFEMPVLAAAVLRASE